MSSTHTSSTHTHTRAHAHTRCQRHKAKQADTCEHTPATRSSSPTSLRSTCSACSRTSVAGGKRRGGRGRRWRWQPGGGGCAGGGGRPKPRGTGEQHRRRTHARTHVSAHTDKHTDTLTPTHSHTNKHTDTHSLPSQPHCPLPWLRVWRLSQSWAVAAEHQTPACPRQTRGIAAARRP